MTLPKLALVGLILSDVDTAAFVAREQTLIRSKTGKKSLARRPAWRPSLQFLKRDIRVVISAEKAVVLFRS
jgi:hypothetical protein